ncbi:CDP-alcohol phosphatidyltransferase family protein [Haloprofundus halophilus]|uniref:CDP-alcohol phosphatidyltransferase family protein n=1 Tax=Haloprofundus halophilus TaxID=2283527 RepID=UPI001300A86A|nr:CDP-alcohol phosphatidyltransferase family protein [Haloprofundus halophilus]
MSGSNRVRRESALASLRRRLGGFASVAALATLFVASALSTTRAATTAAVGTWFLVAAAVLAVELWWALRQLDRNRRAGETLFARLGAGNLVTLGRGVLLAWVAAFVVVDWAETAALLWIPAALYGTAAALDLLDGTLARRNDRVTGFGTTLDLEYDALGVLVACSVGVAAGLLPVWYLPVGFARYAFGLARDLRRRRGAPVYDLPPRVGRRLLAGLQMAFLAVALSPVPDQRARAVGAVAFGGALLLGFARDWLYVSGRVGDGATKPTEHVVD